MSNFYQWLPVGIFCLFFNVYILNAQTYSYTNATFTYVDAARSNRSVPTEIYYPQDGGAGIAQGSFPVVVLAHGFAMGVDAYENWGQELAQRGYIVLMPRTESSLFPSPSHSAFAADINFLCAQILLENANNQSLFFNKIINNIGLIGHSMGGGASFLAAANNTNIKTVIGFAPAETNPSAVSAAAQVQVPTLVLSGSRDGVTPAASNHQPMYDAVSVAHKKLFISLIGGAHCFFANSNLACDFGESTSSTNITLTRAAQQQISYNVVNPWLDYYLKSTCDKLDTLLTYISAESSISYQQNGFSPIVVSLNNNQLVSNSPLANYQWYQNNLLINNANSATYTPLSDGNYQVAEIDVNTCPIFSNSVSFLINASNFIPNDNPLIYYNAYSQRFNSATITQVDYYQIYNMNGQLIDAAAASTLANISSPRLPKGVYMAVFYAANQTYKLTFLVD